MPDIVYSTLFALACIVLSQVPFLAMSKPLPEHLSASKVATATTTQQEGKEYEPPDDIGAPNSSNGSGTR